MQVKLLMLKCVSSIFVVVVRGGAVDLGVSSAVRLGSDFGLEGIKLRRPDLVTHDYWEMLY